ncbi:MAG: TIGR02391 family protein, partial [Ignavibacteriales bacterium]|nr:TIGR02391 family protein [Ignavibacteriales bacterium]
IAVQVGDLLKYDSTINDINRIAKALFQFPFETFPNDSITSSRAKLIHDWILSLARQKMELTGRNRMLSEFCLKISPQSHHDKLSMILAENNVNSPSRENYELFSRRGLHHQVSLHSKKLFLEGNYFHAVFEASKAYNFEVKNKAQSMKDGQALMLEVWSPEKGTLKLNLCRTETERNIQDGIKFLSAGLMQAIRNPTAHEPALTWPIGRDECLDILSFISFLFHQLDKATYYKSAT